MRRGPPRQTGSSRPSPTLTHDLDWMSGADCAGGTLLFFSDDPADQSAARAICRGCLVLGRCAEWRDRVKPSHGIWAAERYSPKKYGGGV